MWISYHPFNNKLNKFVTRSRDSRAFAVDTLVKLLDQFNLIFPFPSLQILPHLLCQSGNKVETFQGLWGGLFCMVQDKEIAS